MISDLKDLPFLELLTDGRDFQYKQFQANSEKDQDYIDWNSYLLPSDYGDAQAEYRAIRDECALFDVSPMRKYRIRGPEAGPFLNYLLTRPVSDMSSMRGIYVIFCNEDGSLKDDAMLLKYAEDDYLLLPSDMDHSAHFSAICNDREFSQLEIDDLTSSFVGLAVQGPCSASVMKELGFEDVCSLEPMAIRDYSIPGGTVKVARMGFTGDLGYECWMQSELSEAFADRIRSVRSKLEMKVPGYGLSALQACRLEGGFIVAGWDCATEAEPNPGFERSPFELGLGWLVNLDGQEFFGKTALELRKESGPQSILRSFQINDRMQPDDGAELHAEVEGREQMVGSINCSAWSWDLDRMIGNASMDSRYPDLERVTVKLVGCSFNVELSDGPHRRFDRARQMPAPLKGN